MASSSSFHSSYGSDQPSSDPFTSPRLGSKGPYGSSRSPKKTSARLARLGRLLFTCYLTIALLYTFWHIVAKPLFISSPAKTWSSQLDVHDPVQEALELAGKSEQDGGEQIWVDKAAQHVAAGEEGHLHDGEEGKGTTADQQGAKVAQPVKPLNWKDYGRIHGVEWDKDMITWHPVNEQDKEGMAMSEDFFLSKAFGESLQPSKVIPYYYRATNHFEKKDITITTLVTSNRFKVLAALVERYRGPVSVTIHVTNDAKTRTELLDSLHSLYTTSAYMSLYVDVHLVIDNFDRQFNMWRNVAKFFSRTDYIMMLDVDFAICTDFRTRILRSQQVLDKLEQGSAAFVVPAFEFVRQEDGLDPNTFPDNKQDLMKLVEEKKIGMFHASWLPGHGASNYTRYYEAKASEVYKVNQYTHAYEPYVIFKKEGTPYCDERFIGYGANKAACLFELYLSGVSFYVLPDDFLIHQSHEYAEAARKNERRYNRKLYLDFREELCFRYLNQFIQNGKLETLVSKNLLVECKKIKGFAGAAGRFISASTGAI